MYREHTVGVVLPAYNEADHVGAVIESMPEYVDRLYAIDDASTDSTWDVICAQMGPESAPERMPTADPPLETDESSQPAVTDGSGTSGPEIVPVKHAVNRGAGGALKTGYGLAERDEIDITVAIDADNQMDPEEMEVLLDPIVEGRADYAKGNRLAGDESADAMPSFRLLGNWLLTLLTKPASGYWGVRDPQNGYTAISHTALSAIDTAAVPDDHDYPNDLLARLNAAGISVADVPMAAKYGDEGSTIEFTNFVPSTSETILRSFVWRVRQEGREGKSRLPALYALGVLGIGLGLLSVLRAIRRAVAPAMETVSESRPSAVTLFLSGAILSVAALFVDIDGESTVVNE